MKNPTVGIWLDPALKPDIVKAINDNMRRGRRRARGCGCWEASMVWAGVLDEAGIAHSRTRVLLGSYDSAGHRFLSAERAGLEPHVWLEIDGAIFDPTGGQWLDFPNLDPKKFLVAKQLA